MNKDELRILKSLKGSTFIPGGWDKRFVRDTHFNHVLHPERELSEKQKEWLYRLLYKYRRQNKALFNEFAGHEYCKKKEKFPKVAKNLPEIPLNPPKIHSLQLTLFDIAVNS